MTVENIIAEIKKGLSNDPKKDVEYLTGELFKYKDKDFYDELAREIGIMIYNVLPEEEQAVFSHALFGENNKNEIIEEANSLIAEEQYLNARIILEQEIKNIKRQNRKEDACTYLSLNTFFELCIYTELYQKGVSVRSTPFDYNIFYKLYGYCLFKLGKNQEAISALKEAIYWNPVGSPCLLDLAELYKCENELDKMVETTKECLKYAYNKHYISKCYRNLGYYYIEKEEYDTAICLYVMANEYEESDQTVKELSKIIAITGKKLKKPTSEEVKKRLEEKVIQFGVNPDLISLAVGIGNDARDKGELEAAKYCYNIVFSLTADIEVMKKVEGMKKEIVKKAYELKK